MKRANKFARNETHPTDGRTTRRDANEGEREPRSFEDFADIEYPESFENELQFAAIFRELKQRFYVQEYPRFTIRGRGETRESEQRSFQTAWHLPNSGTLISPPARPLYGNMTRLQQQPCGVFPVMKSSTEDTAGRAEKHISEYDGDGEEGGGRVASAQQMY